MSIVRETRRVLDKEKEDEGGGESEASSPQPLTAAIVPQDHDQMNPDPITSRSHPAGPREYQVDILVDEPTRVDKRPSEPPTHEAHTKPKALVLASHVAQ